MSRVIPPWFVQKYTLPSSSQSAITQQKPKLSLYRQYLNEAFTPLDPGDTQQEREQLPGQVRPSIRRRIDSETINRLAERYGTKITPQQEPSLLTTTPVRPPPPVFEEGKKIFTDQKKLEEIIAQAPEEGRVISFKEAFKKARNANLKEFEYQGNLFNTREKGETPSQWLSNIQRNQEPSFEDFMRQSGVVVSEEKDIDVSAISKNLGPALERISPIFKQIGVVPEITSGKRSLNTWSLHEIGEAVDLRLKTVPPELVKKLENSLPGRPSDILIENKPGKLWSDGTYEYIIHGDIEGNNIHLHIERETEESKARLVEHMIQLGLEEKIPKKGLSQYPNLLKKYSSILPKVN